MTELDVLHAAEAEVRAEVERKEAEVRESAFLGALGEAQSHFRWLVDHQGWRLLGWDSFAAWWDGRVRPVMLALDARPTREIAAKVIEMVRAEEADLPAAQRRTQRELGELVGVSGDTAARWTGSRSAPDADAPPSDLATPDLRTRCESCHNVLTADDLGEEPPAVDSGWGYRRCAACDPDGDHFAPEGEPCRLCPKDPAKRAEAVAEVAPEYVQIVQPAREGSPAGAGTEATPEVPAAEPATSSSPVAGFAPQPSEAAAERALADSLGESPDYQAARYRAELSKHLQRAQQLTTHQPKRVVEIADELTYEVINNACHSIAAWHEEIKRLRGRGLRVLDGDRS